MKFGSLIANLETTGNVIEAGFWMIFGMILAIGARNQKRSFRNLGLTACLASVLFGLSDLVEARTGAWWRPWWLLVWKTLCGAGLLLCFLRYRQLKSSETLSVPEVPQAPSSSM